MGMSAADLIRHLKPSTHVASSTVFVTFGDAEAAQAFDRQLWREANEIPRDVTRMIRSIDLEEGPEPGRAVLELVDGDGRAHRFFVYADDLTRLATIRLDARRKGGLIATIARPEPEATASDDCREDGRDAASPDAERKDDLLELAHIHTRLDRADDRIRRQQRLINTIMATYVEREHLRTGRFPSYCCQRCGESIGWTGRALQAVGLRLHSCTFSPEQA